MVRTIMIISFQSTRGNWTVLEPKWKYAPYSDWPARPIVTPHRHSMNDVDLKLRLIIHAHILRHAQYIHYDGLTKLEIDLIDQLK